MNSDGGSAVIQYGARTILIVDCVSKTKIEGMTTQESSQLDAYMSFDGIGRLASSYYFSSFM